MSLLPQTRWRTSHCLLIGSLAIAAAAHGASGASAFVSPTPARGSAFRRTPRRCCDSRPLTLLQSPDASQHDDRSVTRRSIVAGGILHSAALIFLRRSQSALAVEDDRLGKKPFAPADTLLPATRVLIMIDKAVDIAHQLNTTDAISQQRQSELLSQLEDLLLKPQNFTRGTTAIDVPQKPAKAYLDSYARYRNRVSLLERPGAMLVQSGEIDTWKRLKRQEKVREDTDEVRAALNYYTSNLNFNSDKYVLTGSREERSKLIREDRLPDVKNVIASDMGLRYLLRNEVLTALGNARAELEYQTKQDTMDCNELLGLLLEAQSSCRKWFDLIDEADRKSAREIVEREG